MDQPSRKEGALRENGVVKWIRYPAYPDKCIKNKQTKNILILKLILTAEISSIFLLIKSYKKVRSSEGVGKGYLFLFNLLLNPLNPQSLLFLNNISCLLFAFNCLLVLGFSTNQPTYHFGNNLKHIHD
ncbi:hypothetical protein ACA081_00775 [Candidatus Hodgkinia cicadicola]